MIVFQNPGVLDIRAAITLGVNVKESDNPIGTFGTGFKYAVAVLLRTGHQVTIWAGLDRYDFSTNPVTIRGKDFGFVTMEKADTPTQSLAFTTEFGKKWEVWMAYRELWCNARDEGGEAYKVEGTDGARDPGADLTQIIVIGPDIDAAHDTRAEFIIDGETPVERFGDVEIFEGSRGVFYRGMRVAEKIGADALDFTYNIRSEIELSEDRSAKSEYQLRSAIALNVMSHASEAIAEKIITSTGGEEELDFDYSWRRPSIAFMRAVKSSQKHGSLRNSSAEKQFIAHHFSSESIKEFAVAPGPAENEMLARCFAFLDAIGLPLHDDTGGEMETVVMTGMGGHDIRITDQKLVIDIGLFESETTLRLALIDRAVMHNTKGGETKLFAKVIDRLGHQLIADAAAGYNTEQYRVPPTAAAPEPRWVLTGEWSGYRETQRKIAHRELITDPQRIERLKSLHTIVFNDGTTFVLTVTEVEPTDPVKEMHGYTSLIRSAEVYAAAHPEKHGRVGVLDFD